MLGIYYIDNGIGATQYNPTLTEEDEAKSIEEMKTQSTYSGFDFENTWEIVENRFPTLKGSNHIFLSQIEAEDIVVATNEEKELKLTLTPEIVDDAVFSYSIEDKEIAAINDNGNIIGLKEGQTKLEISSLYENIFKTVDITVEEAKVLKSIAVTTKPSKTNYVRGENFDPTGMVLTATYDDETTEEITDYTVIDGENLNCLIDKVIIQSKENLEIKAEVQIQVAHDMSNATCSKEGKCKVEGCIYTEEALGHSFINYESNNDATCLEDGTETAKCDRCEETHTQTEEGSALGHNYEQEVIEPTCTEGGYTIHKCTRCDNSYTDNEKAALGHSFINYESNNDATCLEDGTETAKCERCTETHTRTEEGTALGHHYENGICIRCEAEEPKVKIDSSTYTINGTYLSKIPSKTTVEKFKESLETNATEINIYDKNGNQLSENNTLATGMKVELKYQEDIKIFTIAVDGDINGDGKVEFSDLVMANRHRLNKKMLEGEKFIAADLTGDGKVNFIDLVKINQIRLNKMVKSFFGI